MPFSSTQCSGISGFLDCLETYADALYTVRTASDVHAHIEASKASKEALGEKDVLSLLDVLVHGGKLEQYPLSALGPDHPSSNPADAAAGSDEDGSAYRFRTRTVVSGGLLASPCGVCPVSVSPSPPPKKESHGIPHRHIL